MMEKVVGERALGRALLARQLLLDRSGLGPLQAIEHLAGMQSQAPNAPYVGLWTRLDGFGAGQLAALMTERTVVRAHLMRNTVHLVSARDCLALRDLLQPVLARQFASSPFARNLDGADLPAVLEAGRALLAERPHSRPDLGRRLSERWPDRDPASLAYAVTNLVPTVQARPRGVWGAGGPAAFTTVEAWLGEPPGPAGGPDQLVLRYLAAFGPATVADIQAWSGLTRLSEVTERLRPRLRVLRGEDGANLFDLPDAPRPGPDIPAPPRFLPEYDNLLLSHADRSRVIPGRRRVPLPPGLGASGGTLLIDGYWRANWKLDRRDGGTVLRVEPFARLPAVNAESIAAEGARLLSFIAPGGVDNDIRIAPANLSD